MIRQSPCLLHRVLLACLAISVASPVFAHANADVAGGFASGFLHPIGGVDHLLAMVAVGIWGAFLGQPLIWLLPVAFPLVMVIGGVLGIAGVPLPHVQLGIAISVIVLGLAIAAKWRAPTAFAVGLIAIFAIFHGHAHGTELPRAAAPAAYAAGFVVATGLLHLAGIALGAIAYLARGVLILRAGGVGIAAAGIWILLGSPGIA